MTMPATVSDALITAAQAGDNDAMWSIVSLCDPLLNGIVRQVAPASKGEDAEDLLQEARAALIQRIRSYDSTSSSAALQTYVYAFVRRAVAESWVRMSTGLSVEPTLLLWVRKALADWDGNREAAFLAVNAHHTVERSTFMAAVEAMGAMESWDASVGGSRSSTMGENLTLSEIIADPSGDVTDPVERRELAHWLMEQINPRQSYALRSYYGVGMEKADDTAVSMHLRVTPANVRKIRTRGITAAQTVAQSNDLAA